MPLYSFKKYLVVRKVCSVILLFVKTSCLTLIVFIIKGLNLKSIISRAKSLKHKEILTFNQVFSLFLGNVTLPHLKPLSYYRISSKERPGHSFKSQPLRGAVIGGGANLQVFFFGGVFNSFRRHKFTIFPNSCE